MVVSLRRNDDSFIRDWGQVGERNFKKILRKYVPASDFRADLREW
jgi:hypothetical protein